MANPNDADILLIDTQDRVRTLTLNRPQSRNALSAELRGRFFTALRDAEADDDVDVVIVTGADPVFCAGLDLKELGDSSRLPDISPQWPPMAKPVIGAINGAAVTGGLEIALYCVSSYHRIGAAQTDAGLWIEAMSAKQWMNSATGDNIAANRDAVLQRGRAQVR